MLTEVDPYATGVLDKEVHDRLVADLGTYTRDAGIQPQWVWTKLSKTCGPTEMDYVRKFRFHQDAGAVHGLCYVRESGSDADVEEHMSAIAGAFLRNFIRARVMTVHRVLEHLDNNDPIEATVLLVPNFFLSKKEGGDLSKWHVTTLYDMLSERALAGKQTVIYASSIPELKAEYGTAFGRMVDARYLKVEV
jgi:hypothetical protein